MPSSEKMTMKRKRRRSKDAMERTELRSEATRLLRDVQYLQMWSNSKIINYWFLMVQHFIIMLVRELQMCTCGTHFVTLRILSSRMHLRTEKPRGATAPAENIIISRMPQRTTKKSKRLKRDMK